MAKRTTKTEVVLKAMARSGPELRPDQIRLADEAQTDKNKVYTQSDVNQSGGGEGGGGGGGVAPDLSGYATTEQLNSEADARDTGDKANLGLIEANKKDIAAISNDYTTTDEFNTLNGRISQNKKDIASLGEAFDTAVIAAQEGAENLEIELQSYAKKEDIPEGGGASETPTLDQVCKKGGITTETIGAQKYIAGQDFRNGDLSDVGVEVDGEKGIVHIKGKNNTVSPIEVFQSGSNVNNVGSTVFKVDNHGVCTAEEFVGDGSKLTNLPGGAAAPVLPGQKWNLVTAHDLPPAPGEMMWVDGESALYCHATTADGIVLGNAFTSFGQYDVNGTMVVSMYKHGVGIEAVFKAGIVQMITQGGETFWKILKMNHARFNLNEGTAYNVTASGLF